MGRRALAVTAALLVLCGCGGDDDAAASTATKAGVQLRLPAGWALSADGLVAAPSEADLTAKPARGPRVRVVIAKSTARIHDVLDATADGPDVVDGPERVTVDRRAALRISMRIVGNAERDEGVTIRRYLAVESPTGTSILFILEAPAGQFDENEAKLDRVPGWTD